MARRVLHDTYFKLAKAEGYVARSAYKLKQMQAAKHLLRAGDAVLDLGCAPGSWMQVAAELVGPEGIVVGIDLQEVRLDLGPTVHPMQGDVRETPASVLLEPLGERPEPRQFDVVISDMAPNTVGYGDAERSIALCEDVLGLLGGLLRPGGSFAMKVLEGSGYPELVQRTATMFEESKGYKPPASRDISREMYIVAKGFIPQPAAPEKPRRRIPPHLRWPDGTG